MGVPSAGTNDLATLVASGQFTATGQSAPILLTPRVLYNFTVSGTFVGTVSLERSFDGGATWLNCSIDVFGTNNAIGSPVSLVGIEPENGVQYRVNCTACTSGTIRWRISQ